ncbi:helix-turn-helix domain-containing protein [Halocella sp. SP3-1]|uniref:helix-turn-helix transcriptional regulator n=1 Tax=Halocella sp. SP3-1 TaxID=2382161 RepID=UPI000F765562|nr:helix-turn-helix domain-containing protein [Halocella sp. SP3-1]AZO96187.1 helix-turn-helix domain-containing protein [Halocella sp. SP3-1]
MSVKQNKFEVNSNKIKALRAEFSITQIDMAKLLDINPITYQRKEAGESHFSLIEAKKMADYFNMEIENVFFAPKVNKKEHIL